MVKEDLVGVWRLVASEFIGSDGGTVSPWGQEVVGMLIYEAHGYLSVQIMNAVRPMFVSGDAEQGTAEEVKAAFEGYTAYFGTYDVDEEGSIVTHHARGCLFPNWVGQDQVRSFELSGHRLTLKTPPILVDGVMAVGTVVWEREA